MLFILYGWLLFRARSLDQIFSLTLALGNFSSPPWLHSFVVNLALFTLPVVAVDFWQEKSGNRLAPLDLPAWGKAILQGSLLLAILLFWEKDKVPFIYFQF